MPGLDQTAVRRVNIAVVLRALAATEDHTTLKDLVGQTGLSRRTIELILGELTTEGWARESLSESGGGAGRPARRFHFAADHYVVGAARIDTHLAHAAIADLSGRILGTATRALSDYQNPRIAVADAAMALEAAAADAGTGLDRLCVGAVAAGGVIDPEGFVRRLLNAPAWSGRESRRARRALGRCRPGASAHRLADPRLPHRCRPDHQRRGPPGRLRRRG
jgi:hypothetical protein